MPLWRPLNWFCARINFLNKNGQFKTLREKDHYLAQFNFNSPYQNLPDNFARHDDNRIPNLPLRVPLVLLRVQLYCEIEHALKLFA